VRTWNSAGPRTSRSAEQVSLSIDSLRWWLHRKLARGVDSSTSRGPQWRHHRPRQPTPLSKVDPDPDPIHFLRRYSSFITPKVGLLSADTWTFVAIYLRNLLLNWMVFIP